MASKCGLGVALVHCGPRKAIMSLLLWTFLGYQWYKHRKKTTTQAFLVAWVASILLQNFIPQRKSLTRPQSGADQSGACALVRTVLS